jgi:hypothetical protein
MPGGQPDGVFTGPLPPFFPGTEKGAGALGFATSDGSALSSLSLSFCE